MSETPRTDAIIEADWHMPKGWKARIYEHARRMERDRALLIEALKKCQYGDFSKEASSLLRALGESE